MDIKKILEKINYKRLVFISIILTSLGVVLMNTSSTLSLEVVFIAIGGLFLIAGLSKQEQEAENTDP